MTLSRNLRVEQAPRVEILTHGQLTRMVYLAISGMKLRHGQHSLLSGLFTLRVSPYGGTRSRLFNEDLYYDLVGME